MIAYGMILFVIKGRIQVWSIIALTIFPNMDVKTQNSYFMKINSK